MEQRSHFSIFEANSIFLILAGIFLTVGAYFQSKEVLSGLLITEYGIIFVPILLYALVTKKDLRGVFRVKKIPLKQCLKIVAIAILLLPTVAIVNMIAILLIELFSDAIVLDIPTATNGVEYLGLMFIISITAGICEETFFRGMVLDAYETELGRKWGAIFSGFLFAIFHFNPQNFFGPLVLGIMFSYLVQLTGSIFAGILAHATNNGIAVSLGFWANLVSDEADMMASGGQLYDSIGLLIGMIVGYGVLALGFAIVIKGLLKSLRKDYATFEIGDSIEVNTKRYDIIDMEAEKLIIKAENSEELLTTDLERLSKVGISHEYKLWDKRPLKLPIGAMVPVMIAAVAYGYIFYLAYLRA